MIEGSYMMVSRIIIPFNSKKITLVPFSAQQVTKDQRKIHGEAKRKVNETNKRDEGLIMRRKLRD